MTRTIRIKTVATGTVYETWRLFVPDDFDVTDRDAVWAAFNDMDSDLAIVDEQINDEYDREMTTFEVEP